MIERIGEDQAAIRENARSKGLFKAAISGDDPSPEYPGWPVPAMMLNVQVVADCGSVMLVSSPGAATQGRPTGVKLGE